MLYLRVRKRGRLFQIILAPRTPTNQQELNKDLHKKHNKRKGKEILRKDLYFSTLTRQGAFGPVRIWGAKLGTYWTRQSRAVLKGDRKQS